MVLLILVLAIPLSDGCTKKYTQRFRRRRFGLKNLESGKNNFVPKFTSVGVVLPYDAPSGWHIFQLCHEETCIPAGKIFSYSRSTHSDHNSDSPVGKSTHRVAEDDVTELVDDNFPNTDGKELRAELIETGIKGLPQPLIIQQTDLRTNKYTVIIHPDQKAEDYGDLLKEYEGGYEYEYEDEDKYKYENEYEYE